MVNTIMMNGVTILRSIFTATESDISRSSAVSSKDSKKTKDKPKTPTKSGDLNVEESFDNGFKASQSIFLPDIKTGIDE